MSAAISLNNVVTKPSIGNGYLEKDNNGYYKVNLGGFNVFNLHNEFYRVKDLNALINDPKKVFYKRLHGGYLNGEAEHPKMTPGMNPNHYYLRNLRIALENTSHHIRSDLEIVSLNTPCNVPGAGKPVRVLGWIKPSGKHGQALQSFLDNPHQNTAFSIRAITTPPVTIGGYVVKDVVEIITWDWVDIPGIFQANKWSTIAKENYDIALESYLKENYSDVDIRVEEILYPEEDFITSLSFEDAHVQELNRSILNTIKNNMVENKKDVLYKW